jgi:hypothetical protein
MATEETATTKSQAQQLLDSQRDSVAFLTKMRGCLEQIFQSNVNNNNHHWTESLQRHGFGYVDGFLNRDSNDLDALQKEDLALLMMNASSAFQMQQDVNYLGSGEYTVPIKGGSEQYQICPRSIEWVVATTKHWGIGMANWNNLDHTNCMAIMRTFDRKAQLASWKLITGESSANWNDQNTTAIPPRVFEMTVVDGNVDKRRISMRYYLVDDEWDESCGGGLTFVTKTSGQHQAIAAKRDRLVVWQSDSCMVRQEIWNGSDQFNYGSCIELHLLEK